MDNFYFKFGTITNCAAVNILERGFGDTYVHFSVVSISLGVVLLDSRLCIHSVLPYTVKQCSKVNVPVSIPSSNV